MRSSSLLCAVAALSLAACQKSETQAPANTPAAAAAPRDAAAPAAPKLAYAHSVTLAAPQDGLRQLFSRHEETCRAAGSDLCQVLGASLEMGSGGGRSVGQLDLRASPEWLRTFQSGLDADARAVGGRVASTTTTAEDVSTPSAAGEAALKARVALRDELREILRTGQGRPRERVAVAQQLAQLEAEIAAARRDVRALAGRAALSNLTLVYRSQRLFEGRGGGPLAEAADDGVELLVMVTGLLVRMLGVVLPVGALVAGGWALGRLLQARRTRTRRPA